MGGGTARGDEHGECGAPVEGHRGLIGDAAQLLQQTSGRAARQKTTLGQTALPFVIFAGGGNGIFDQRACWIGAGDGLPATAPGRLVIIDEARLGTKRLRLRLAGGDQLVVALTRALSAADAVALEGLPGDGTRQRLFDVFVGRDLFGNLHQVVVGGIVETRVGKVPEHDVMHFV